MNNKYIRSKRSKENFGRFQYFLNEFINYSEKHKSKNTELLKRFQWYFEQNKYVNDYLQRISQNNIKF